MKRQISSPLVGEVGGGPAASAAERLFDQPPPNPPHKGEGFRRLKLAPDAIEQARLHRPVAIVTDIFMPRLDGIDLTRHLRADPQLANIPVVAQTAYINAIDTHRELFAAVLEKPCQPSELLAALAELGIHPESG